MVPCWKKSEIIFKQYLLQCYFHMQDHMLSSYIVKVIILILILIPFLFLWQQYDQNVRSSLQKPALKYVNSRGGESVNLSVECMSVRGRELFQCNLVSIIYQSSSIQHTIDPYTMQNIFVNIISICTAYQQL